MAQLTIANSNTHHYVKMLCTTTTKPPSTSKWRFQKNFFSRSKNWNTPFYLQMICPSGRSLSWNTPVFTSFTSREHANFIGYHFFHAHVLPYHSKTQLLRYCGKSSFLGVAKSWKVTLDRVPWFGRHVENLGDVIIYLVLDVAPTGQRTDKAQSVAIEEFTLIVASWVIRAGWREIRRFLSEFKAS